MFGTIVITVFVLGPAGVMSQTAQNNSISQRIIGGYPAAEGQFPYQVSIRFNGIHNCGGSIISPFWILTAAHCVFGYPINSLLVIVGTNQVKLGTPYRVTQAIAHKNFVNQHLINDIALIQVAGPINFNNKAKPIQLSTSLQPPGTSCVLSGWGNTNLPMKTIPDLLQYIEMGIVDLEQCKASIKNGNPIGNTNVCAFNAPGRAGCYGDSGGPLVCNGMQYGVVSWGLPYCAAGVPDVFTSVPAYRRWIATYSGV